MGGRVSEDQDEDGAPYSFFAQALLEAGAKIDAREKRGLTPFAVAIFKENWSAVRTLVHSGALMSEEQRQLVFDVADGAGWHELEEWRCRRTERSLDQVLARPGEERFAVRARM